MLCVGIPFTFTPTPTEPSSNPSVCLVMGGNVATMHSNGIPVGPELGLRKLGVVLPRASKGVKGWDVGADRVDGGRRFNETTSKT